MVLDTALLDDLLRQGEETAWRRLVETTLEITSAPLTPSNAVAEVSRRERAVASLDHLLAGSAWDLWSTFGGAVERTSAALVRWWDEQVGGRAVLILDGLSLRELPWLLQGAAERGFQTHLVEVHASELPGETNPFARALGFQSRSQLQNNSAGQAHRLTPAATESANLAWKDSAGLVDSSPNWAFWHHWPDRKLHDSCGAGEGLEALTRDAVDQLTSEDFWSLVARLATGRRLLVTSDHGYAATGGFPDASPDVGQFLKAAFSSGRNAPGAGDAGPFVPPVAMSLAGSSGPHHLALGRRKWKSQGGYPTLTHGGLSLLEVLCPFLELTK